MTKQQHPAPITPPPELVMQWYDEAKRDPCGSLNWIAVKAAQWGADQELEACRLWLDVNGAPFKYIDGLLDARRRPKPPSLKAQALQEVDALEAMGACDPDVIRLALEALPDD